MTPTNLSYTIQKAHTRDTSAIYDLYKAVAHKSGGIARQEHEITLQYIADLIEKCSKKGIILVAKNTHGKIVAEGHASAPELEAFAHILTDPTFVVHPEMQGAGIGTALLQALIEDIRLHYPHILRFELFVRESNTRAIALYEKIGFAKEGRLQGRIKTAEGTYEADIIMAWLRPLSSKL